jgi:AraC family transcriptional regulator
MDNLLDNYLNISQKFNDDISLRAFIECLPYPIIIYKPDGAPVMVNKNFLKSYNIQSAREIVDKYNVFKDIQITTPELLPCAKRVFCGESFFSSNLKAPLEHIVLRFGIRDFDIEAMYIDVAIFPICDDNGKIPYAAALFINRRIYRGKKEIAIAQEYIKSHYMDKFDIGKIAKAAHLSKTHLTRLFKKHTGMTMYDYYLSVKIDRLQEKLLDAELSVAQAFSACGLTYNGYFARVFKQKTGLSPSKFREKHAQRYE